MIQENGLEPREANKWNRHARKTKEAALDGGRACCAGFADCALMRRRFVSLKFVAAVNSFSGPAQKPGAGHFAIANAKG
jgi:hypothetical protein